MSRKIDDTLHQVAEHDCSTSTMAVGEPNSQTGAMLNSFGERFHGHVIIVFVITLLLIISN